MLDFSQTINLPLVWGIIIAVAILMYVILDGFDLGVGILFPLAPSDKCRDRMMNSIAPFWDGNETWLVLGGGGLFAAFPLAYSVLLPSFYTPLIIMLMGLIMRGVAFEFRFKASDESRFFWDYCFHIGSLIATFFQGVILGAFVIGTEVEGGHFAGDVFDCTTAFSMMTGIAMVFGYALLGSTWLVMKTQDITQNWARKVSKYVMCFVAVFMSMVSVSVPFLEENISTFWFSKPNMYYLAIIPLITGFLFYRLWIDIRNEGHQNRPFFLTIGLFIMGYLSLALSIYPWIIPYHHSIWEAAASNESLSLMLVGVGPLLPIILGYTAYSYYIFRGKSSSEKMY
jgi:cytochrome bd ubiquinol oxidase subunit II